MMRVTLVGPRHIPGVAHGAPLHLLGDGGVERLEEVVGLGKARLTADLLKGDRIPVGVAEGGPQGEAVELVLWLRPTEFLQDIRRLPRGKKGEVLLK